MKNIKFRVWDGENMLSISEAMHNDSVCVQHNRKDGFSIEPNYDDVDIMQYIGLKDKNNKEIYEGDIVKVQALYDSTEGEVVFNNCAWCFIVPVSSDTENKHREIRTGWYGIEITGNKYTS